MLAERVTLCPVPAVTSAEVPIWAGVSGLFIQSAAVASVR